MRPFSLVRVVLAVSVLLFMAKLGASEQTFNYSSITAVRNIVPQKTDHYTIDSEVRLQAPYYVFSVKSASGDSFEVKGITALIKVCHEISVIELFKQTEQGSQVWTGARTSLQNMGKGAKQIVIHPGDSAVALGRSLARTTRGVGRFFKGLVKGEEKSSTGENLADTPGNFFTSDQARIAAYELRVDVYSGNPYVQAVLEQIARKRWAGSLGVSAAGFLIPGAGTVALLTTGVLTPGAFVDVTEQMIRDNPPQELNREIERQLMVSLGVGKDSREMQALRVFLQNPNYTPRQKAYIGLYLEHLAELKNFVQAVNTLGLASTVANAEVLFMQMQMLSAVHRNGTRLAEFAPQNERIAGRLGRGDVIFILPYDYVDASGAMLAELKNVPAGSASRNIWLLGESTRDFERAASSAGISKILVDILHYQEFQKAVSVAPLVPAR